MRKPALWPRNSHRWLSIVVVLPMLLVAATGMLFEYVQPMGWRKQQVNAGWLPGYAAAQADPARDVRGVAADGAGWWVADRSGLYHVQGSQVQAVPALALSTLPDAAPVGRIAVSTLIHDLHTGKALLGEHGEWAWNHIVGLSLLFLCGSGFYMWWKHRQARPRKLARKPRAPRIAEETST